MGQNWASHLGSGPIQSVLTSDLEEMIVITLEQCSKMGWLCGDEEVKQVIVWWSWITFNIWNFLWCNEKWSDNSCTTTYKSCLATFGCCLFKLLKTQWQKILLWFSREARMKCVDKTIFSSLLKQLIAIDKYKHLVGNFRGSIVRTFTT